MGVYIKGMEMPKDKAVAVVIHPDGTAYTAEMSAGVCTEYLADCTAVPVPPHGDLIDALEEMRLMQSCEYDTYDDYSRAFDMLDNAPTVIPAEE